MKTSSSWLLLALCLCASTTGLSAAQDIAPVHGVAPTNLRALQDRDLADKPVAPVAQPTKESAVAADGGNEPKRAIHRVYDAKTGLYCEILSDCDACSVSEKDEVYCRETGHRQELKCFKSDGVGAKTAEKPTEVRFQACAPVEKAHPVLRVITFEIIMAGLLAGAFILLQKERRKHLSAFDLRKDPRQRSTLLGDKNHD